MRRPVIVIPWLAASCAAAYIYQQWDRIPARMAVTFFRGNPSGWASKSAALPLMLGLMFGILAVFTAVLLMPRKIRRRPPAVVSLTCSSTRIPAGLLLLLPLAALQAQQPQYRSAITIFDRVKGTTRVLFTAETVFEAPNWSHDGKYLLVNSAGNLFRLKVDDPSPIPEKIDLGAAYRCNNDHGFTRDGGMLAFSATLPPARASQVFQATAEGKNVRLMTPVESASYFHGWSPDGNWLAFVGQRNGVFELYRVAAAGGPEERLTSHGGYDDGPDYSPDGKWIYFNSNRSGGWDLWRIPPEGAGPNDAKAERVTRDELEDWFPHVSPDGKWIVFLSFPKGTENHNGKMAGVQLRLIPAPGKSAKPSSIRVLTTFFGGQGTINVNSWSPDSRRFAFVSYQTLTVK